MLHFSSTTEYALNIKVFSHWIVSKEVLHLTIWEAEVWKYFIK